jgi:predicted AlkP superfamily pyrophosphatase or phosphodiesterase
LVGTIAVLVAAVAVYALRPEPLVPEDAPTQDEMADALGATVMLHLYRGHSPGRSGDLLVVPKPNHFLISEWDLRTLASDVPFEKTTHAGPWDYLTQVPIVAYGPDLVEQGRSSDDPVDIAALAPTYARILGMDGFRSPTCSLELIVACDKRGGIDDPPRVIFTVVIDGAGWNVLRRYPDAWPNIKALMEDGLVYRNATIGSAPATTGALHATFGTGFYPIDHGLPGNILRTPEGEIEDVYLDDADPRYLEKPTVSELWDEQNDNEPIVGTISFEGWHLGMIGHGAQRDGGDKDLAAIWDRPGRKWTINESFYALPASLEKTDLNALRRYENALDPRDGREDGKWFSETPLSLRRNKNERASSPAFARLMGDAAVDLLETESVGKDELTDLIWVELKIPDSAGHAWNLIRPEVEDVLKVTDAQIGRFRNTLDSTVGEGNYLFMLSADHGQQPLPDTDTGWRIMTSELERDIVTHFGPVVEAPSPADIYLDLDAMEEKGITTDDIARWLGDYTVGQNIPDGAPGRDLVPQARLDDRLFAAVLSTDFFESLTFERIRSFGESEYPEGNYPADFGD